MDGRMGANINGPSLIRVPDWIEQPLGRYYLYFGHHRGTYIRLAYADQLEGPWRTLEAGVLDLADSFCHGHLASPDVHVDHQQRQIRLYYHGPQPGRGQVTRLALSADGLSFVARPEILGVSYFRVFQWQGWHYAMGMPGILYRSADGLGSFVEGPTLFSANMRHCALKLTGDQLQVFYSNAGDCPERILVAGIDLAGDWTAWREGASVSVLEPETEYEGASLPLEPSSRGPINEPVRQLRDPGVFCEAGQTYLLYAVAGEQGLALARLRG
ncbi:MAG: hypothetical protein GKR89_09025 [Candidatus Latescibacteria bacterium]|nr:hypothetical protein [Candidatus Latescibacterota bacterium]